MRLSILYITLKIFSRMCIVIGNWKIQMKKNQNNILLSGQKVQVEDARPAETCRNEALRMIIYDLKIIKYIFIYHLLFKRKISIPIGRAIKPSSFIL